MPYLTINEAAILTPKADGTPSWTGHMWYQLTDDFGNMNSYGFGPKGAPTANGPGAVNRTDSSNYLDRPYTRTVWISESRYDAMIAFGEATAKAAPDSWVVVKDINGNYQSFQLHYNGLVNSCVQYTWKVMEVGGLNSGIGAHPGGYEGFLIPQFNSDLIDDNLNRYENRLSQGMDQTSTYDWNGSQGTVWDPELGYVAPETVVFAEAERSKMVADTEYLMWDAYENDQITFDTYWDLTTSVSDLLLTGSSTGMYMPIYSLDSLTLDPIGAFYDSQSSVYDQALSIADRTGVLVDSSGHRVSVATLQGLDANRDGLLSIAEASGLKLVTDLNENGHLDAGELNAVTSAILSVNWNRLTLGNAVMAGYEVGTALPTVITLTQPTQVNLTQAVPNSNYRTLRDTDNLYILPYLQWINWSANQIKINKGTQNTLIGTDGNDNFDSSYYKNYASWFPTPLTNFLGGGGDDPNTSESRNIHVTYFNNTLYLNKRAA